MKQVYAIGRFPSTAADSGTPVASVREPQICAMTAGIDPGSCQQLLPYLGYAPPPGRLPEAAEPLPIRLALLSLGPIGRVLVHVTPHDTGYFTHALLNVPAAADAQLVIQTWGSPGWEVSWDGANPGSSTELPELPYLPVAEVMDDNALRAWLNSPNHQEVLEFALTALISTPPSTRIFLAVTAPDMAYVIYGVARAMPPGMLDDFTFSTYEPEPLQSPARLIGHDTGSSEWDLPEACFTDAGVAFNPRSGQRSLLPDAVPFAGFAVKALANAEYGPLDEFKATWQRLGMSGTRQFDLVFRLARGTGVLTKEETAEALQYPPLTAWVSARTDALNQFLEWALDDRHFAEESFSRVVQSLRQKPEILTKLGQTVRDEGLKAVRNADRTRTANALEVILPMVAPAKANAVWGELLEQITDPESLSWELRWFLLPKFVRFKHQSSSARSTASPALAETVSTDPALAKWLDVPPERLGEALALDLPRAYHLALARKCLARDGEPTATLVQTLAGHPALTLNLLQPVSAEDSSRSVALYEALLSDSPSFPWLEELLANSSNYPRPLLNRFFELTLNRGQIHPDRLIRTQGSQLLELFSGQSGLNQLGKQFLAEPPADILEHPGLLDFLGKLRDEPGISSEVKERAAAILTIRRYLDHPTFDPADTAPVAAAFMMTPPVVPPSTKSVLFTAVGNALLQNADNPELQSNLEAILLHFGPVLANDPVDLYENLLRDLRSRTDFTRHPNLVISFLAIGLGANKSPELSGKLEGLDVHAFAIASDAAKRGGKRMLEAIDRHAVDWPSASRSQWLFLSAAVRPRGLAGFLRDAGLFLAGTATGAGILELIRWLR